MKSGMHHENWHAFLDQLPGIKNAIHYTVNFSPQICQYLLYIVRCSDIGDIYLRISFIYIYQP
jgi:hypothetical protein